MNGYRPREALLDRVARVLLQIAPDGSTGQALDLAGRLLVALLADGLEVRSTRKRGDVIALGDTDAVIVDRLGSVAYIAQPSGELGFALDIGGPLNRPPSHDENAGPPRDVEVRFLLSPGQAAELVVEILNAARNGGDPPARALFEALDGLGFRQQPD